MFWNPTTHMACGVPYETAVDGIIAGLRDARARRRGCTSGRIWPTTRSERWRGSEAPAFRVGETEALAVKLGFEDTVFLLQVGDDLWLKTSDPTGEHGEQEREDHGLSSGWRL
jgi:hypothetical protein